MLEKLLLSLITLFTILNVQAEEALYPQDLDIKLCSRHIQIYSEETIIKLTVEERRLFWLAVWANSAIKAPSNNKVIYWSHLVPTFCDEVERFDFHLLMSGRLNEEFLMMTIKNIQENFKFVR